MSVLLLGALLATSIVGTADLARADTTNQMFPESFVAGDPPFPGTTFAYTNVDCPTPGTGTFSYEAAGIASNPPAIPAPVAPYPGTFTETGTVTMVGGVVTAFHAEFTIDSPAGTVTGTKDLRPGDVSPGACEGSGPTPTRAGAALSASYQAQTPSGIDSGCTHVTIDNVAPGFFPPDAGSGSIPAGAMVALFDATCEPRVAGSVTDQNGDPFPAGTSGVGACPGPTASTSCPGQIVTFADADGDYVLHLTPGEWTLGGFAIVDGNLLLSDTVTVTLSDGETIVVDFTVIRPTPLAGGASFVVGDAGGAVGSMVTFWSKDWVTTNPLTTGSAPAAFKGYADAASPSCGSTWRATKVGDAARPPADVPDYMTVVVTSSVAKTGSGVSGTVERIVIVRTDPEYASNPGHPGTGTVVAVVCEA